MKQIVCEMCGGKELLKQDGVFVCQSCGTKYSAEEAKKMMVEVDTSVKLANALEKARRAMENKNYIPAQEYYEIILKEEPDNWEAAFYSVYSERMQMVTLHRDSLALVGGVHIKTVLKNIKFLDDITQQNKAIEQIKTDLFALNSEAYKLIIDNYNSQKPTFEGYDKSFLGSFFENEDVINAKITAKIEYTNLARNRALLFLDELNFFGNELVLEFGKNEFTNSINIQCHETALNTLKKLHNETFINQISLVKVDESKFISILQQYADELEMIKPSQKVPKTPEKESSQPFDLDSFLTSKKTSERNRDFSFLTKPLIPDTGCGCLPAICTAPIFIIAIIVLVIISAIINPQGGQTQNTSNIEECARRCVKKIDEEILKATRNPKLIVSECKDCLRGCGVRDIDKALNSIE
jgi:uncharacterized Zn finger protein (UPF0148 family)